MAMSRKNYQAVADAFKDTKPSGLTNPDNTDNIDQLHQWEILRQWEMDVEKVAEVFKADNYRFRYDLFYKACGYQPEVYGT